MSVDVVVYVGVCVSVYVGVYVGVCVGVDFNVGAGDGYPFPSSPSHQQNLARGMER